LSTLFFIFSHFLDERFESASTKTVYEMIHRDKIKGIKSFIFPRMIKLKFREKTNGHSKVKKIEI